MSSSESAEALRQQALWQALQAAGPAVLPSGARALPGPRGRAAAVDGVLAGQAHAQAAAHRALLARHPVLDRLLGESALRALARDLWRAHPPRRGDLALFGDEAGDWLAAREELAAWPWLPDLARLETRLHQAETAADVPPEVAERGLDALAGEDPACFALVLAPGSGCLWSDWPVAELWMAHADGEADGEADAALAPAQAEGLQRMLASPRPQAAWVWRRGWQARAAPIDDTTAAWHAVLLCCPSLDTALQLQLQRAPGFDLGAWLRQALTHGWLSGTKPVPPAEPHDEVSA